MQNYKKSRSPKFTAWSSLLSHNFKPDNRKNQRAEEKHPPESGRFMEYENTQQHRSNGSNTCPDGIGDANGDGLRGFCQKHGTQHIEHGKAWNPQPIFCTDCKFGFAEAECEACFTEAGDDEDEPIHGCKSTKKTATQAFAWVAD